MSIEEAIAERDAERATIDRECAAHEETRQALYATRRDLAAERTAHEATRADRDEARTLVDAYQRCAETQAKDVQYHRRNFNALIAVAEAWANEAAIETQRVIALALAERDRAQESAALWAKIAKASQDAEAERIGELDEARAECDRAVEIADEERQNRKAAERERDAHRAHAGMAERKWADACDAAVAATQAELAALDREAAALAERDRLAGEVAGLRERVGMATRFELPDGSIVFFGAPGWIVRLPGGRHVCQQLEVVFFPTADAAFAALFAATKEPANG